MRLLLHTSATKSISGVPSIAATCEATICVITAGIGITWITSGTFVDICNKKNYRGREGEGGREREREREGGREEEGVGKGKGKGEGEGARDVLLQVALGSHRTLVEHSSISVIIKMIGRTRAL